MTPLGRLQRQALDVLAAPGFSRLVGRLAGAELPAPLVQAVIRWYIGFYGVDVSEMERPPETYTSFDAFFTRRLRDGVHVVDDAPDIAVSPVDGRVYSAGPLASGRIEQVKGRTYGLAELLDSEREARRFVDGHYVTIYLSPRDYHRIHCPIAGRITHLRYVPGRLYPVNAMGLRLVDGLFAVNERLITYLDTDLGPFAVVKVGATNVGMISTSYHDLVTNQGQTTARDERFDPSIDIGRADELGMFHLGSTVVVISGSQDVKPVPLESDQYLRMGQRLFA